MNERINGLWWKARIGYNNQNCDPEVLEKFAELIVRECMKLNKVETTARDLPEYNLGMLEGYRRARENMGIHFGIEQ